jgi:3-oxoacyl-[acyl-carrier protein] reductase
MASGNAPTESIAPRRVAVVTGGSRGIGREIVKRLAGCGVAVCFSYRQDAQAANAVVEELRAAGAIVQAVAADARDAAASAALVEKTIAEHGRLDILINNAGITADKLLPQMDPAAWTSVLETSLNGLYGATKAATLRMMRQRAGRVVNITSVSGLVGIAGQTNYSAAKAAIIGFSRSLAKEMAPWGIPVNAVAPGFVETDMLGGFTDAQRTAAVGKVPMRRFASADEIAGVVGYLVLDAPTYLTGQTIVIDGGLSS